MPPTDPAAKPPRVRRPRATDAAPPASDPNPLLLPPDEDTDDGSGNDAGDDTGAAPDSVDGLPDQDVESDKDEGLGWAILVDDEGKAWGGMIVQSTPRTTILVVPAFTDKGTNVEHAQRWCSFNNTHVRRIHEATELEAVAVALARLTDPLLPWGVHPHAMAGLIARLPLKAE